MPDAREDLRSTAEAIREDASQVEELESEKLALDPGDPRVATISERVAQLASSLKEKAAAELELSEEIQAAG